MKLNEIWEFDNGLAYDLCRVVSENPLAVIHHSNPKSAYLVRQDAHGWRKVGVATEPLTFTPKITKKKRND